MNYTDEEWTKLWCACNGNSTAIPFHARIEEKLKELHENAWSQGMIYISVVLALYLAGLSIIIMRSGHERRPLPSVSLSCLMPSSSQLTHRESKKSSVFRMSRKGREEKTMEMEDISTGLNCAATANLAATPAIKVTIDSSPTDDV